MIDLEAARKTAQEAEARADKATPGPWLDGRKFGTEGHIWGPLDDLDQRARVVCASRYPGQEGQVFASEHDRSFIVAARTDVPALCKLVRDLSDEIERLREESRNNDDTIEALGTALARHSTGEEKAQLARLGANVIRASVRRYEALIEHESDDDVDEASDECTDATGDYLAFVRGRT